MCSESIQHRILQMNLYQYFMNFQYACLQILKEMIIIFRLFKSAKEMQCPQCHGLSVIIKDGSKLCQAAGCTYMSFHVITYENEIRQFEGEKGAENRFTMMNGNGQHKEKQSTLEKSFRTASKYIKALAGAMKLSTDIVDKAEAKAIQILKIKYPEGEKETPEEQEQKTGKGKDKDRITTSNKNIGAFCLYAACFDKKMYFKDVRIANEMELSKDKWADLLKELKEKLKDVMIVPNLNLEHHVLRVCEKQKIRDVEKNAMLEMVARIKNAELVGGNRPSTIAACIFWQIMIRSSYYNPDDQFDIKNYLRSKDTLDEQNGGWWTQTHFEASFDAIRKFKNEHLAPLLNRLIPDFEGRREVSENKNG